MADENDFRPGDREHALLRKILARTKQQIDDSAQAAAVVLATAATTAAATVAAAAAAAAILAAVPAVNPFFLQGIDGVINGKIAKVFQIKGRRAGFAAINVFQDVAEFLALTTALLPELTGAESLELVSSSASDTAAGTGTRTVRITYLDTSNVLVQSAPIALNGTTPVPVPFPISFIWWVESSSGGTNEVSAGNILLRIAGGGVTHDQISAGENRSLSCRLKVPIGFTAFIQTWHATSTGGATQDVRLRATVNEADRTLSTRYASQSQSFVENGQSVTHELPWFRFPELTRIKVSTIPSGSAAANRINTDFSMIIIEN